MRVKGYHLSPDLLPPAVTVRRVGEVEVEVPVLNPPFLRRVAESLSHARQRGLARIPVRDLVEVLTRAIGRLQDREDPLRQLAEATIPAPARLSPAMTARGIDLMCRPWDSKGILALLEAEVSDPRSLDRVVPCGNGRTLACGPDLCLLILAGNIPGVGLPSLIAALLAKSAVLVKTAAGEPLFFPLLARAIAETDPAIGACLAVLPWQGGEVRIETEVFAQAGCVVAYGGAAAMESLRPRVRGPLVEHGPRVSVGLVGREMPGGPEAIAEQVAADVGLFDQRGCLSPHCLYVEEGGPVSAVRLAEVLAVAFAAFEGCCPAGPASPDEASRVRSVRAEIEARAIAGEGVRLWTSGTGTAWTVIYDPDPSFRLSSLRRTLWVKPLQTLGEVESLLAGWRTFLQAAGIAVPMDRLSLVSEMLGRCGVTRVCPLGRMQEPPTTWRPDGRSPFTGLLRTVQVEA